MDTGRAQPDTDFGDSDNLNKSHHGTGNEETTGTDGSGPAGQWPPGTVILNQFRVEHLLGSGGAARVYRVSHLQTGDVYALKVPGATVAPGTLRQQLFFRELRTWMDLPSHPNLTTCYFFKSIENHIGIFAECVQGPSLDAAVIQQSLLEIHAILDTAIQIARGLTVAHAAGVVHQDIKPSNVLLTPDGVAKITDFGLSRVHDLIHAGTGPSVGELTSSVVTNPSISRGILTPSYCSIEQKKRIRPDHRTDMWSFALTVLTLFAGPTWWDNGAEGQAILKRYYENSPRPPYPAMPQALHGILHRCLEPDRNRRWADMHEVTEQLVRLYASVTGTAYPRPNPGTRIPFRNRHVLAGIPLGYKSPEDWLKKASLLEPCPEIRVNPSERRRVKSRKTELLLHVEMLEEAFRIYGDVFSRGRRDLITDIIHLLMTLAETHLAAENAPGALNAYTRAINTLRPIVAETKSLDLQCLLADVLSREASVLTDQGEFTGAVQRHEQAIGLCENTVSRRVTASAVARLANLYLARSTTAGKAGDYAAAVTFAQRATAVCRDHPDIFKEDALKAIQAACYNNEANALQITGHFNAAIEAYDTAETAFKRIRSRDTTRSHCKLAVMSMNRGRALIRIGQPCKALEYLDRSIALLNGQIRKLGRKEHLRELAIALQHRSEAYRALQRWEEAMADVDASIEIREMYYRRTGMMEMGYDLGLSWLEKGRIFRDMTHYDDASKWLAKATDLLEDTVKRSPTPMAICQAAHALSDQALVCLRTGTAKHALALVTRALDRMEELISTRNRHEFSGDMALIQAAYGQVLDAMERRKAAAAIRREAAIVLTAEAARTGRADFQSALSGITTELDNGHLSQDIGH